MRNRHQLFLSSIETSCVATANACPTNLPWILGCMCCRNFVANVTSSDELIRRIWAVHNVSFRRIWNSDAPKTPYSVGVQASMYQQVICSKSLEFYSIIERFSNYAFVSLGFNSNIELSRLTLIINPVMWRVKTTRFITHDVWSWSMCFLFSMPRRIHYLRLTSVFNSKRIHNWSWIIRNWYRLLSVIVELRAVLLLLRSFREVRKFFWRTEHFQYSRLLIYHF